MNASFNISKTDKVKEKELNNWILIPYFSEFNSSNETVSYCNINEPISKFMWPVHVQSLLSKEDWQELIV